jgi:ribosome production factor 1
MVSIKNKIKRGEIHLRQKKAKEAAKRDERFRRKREEAKNPALRETRLAQNIPQTLDRKRTWDAPIGDEEDALGLAVDVEYFKRRKIEEEQQEAAVSDIDDEDSTTSEPEQDALSDKASSQRSRSPSVDSMLDEGSSDEENARSDSEPVPEPHKFTSKRAPSPTATSTGTNLDLTPEFLMSKFPTLMNPPSEPKILITTSLNSTLHDQARILTTFFPNSNYIPRSAHKHAYKYSVREIAQFASNRDYTTLIVLMEDQKKPCGLDVVHLPSGPMFHFSISNWVEGKKLPGHGNPTNHFPEIILNNFRTPLGMLTAHLFRTMFPPQPEIQGRQVVTMHNQRDYIFVRRHRYVFRDKRPTEKSVTDTDGKPVKGVEDIKVGLQELGPRFTLKLRRVDRGIQRRSGQEWEWKARQEKKRTRFQM